MKHKFSFTLLYMCVCFMAFGQTITSQLESSILEFREEVPGSNIYNSKIILGVNNDSGFFNIRNSNNFPVFDFNTIGDDKYGKIRLSDAVSLTRYLDIDHQGIVFNDGQNRSIYSFGAMSHFGTSGAIFNMNVSSPDLFVANKLGISAGVESGVLFSSDLNGISTLSPTELDFEFGTNNVTFSFTENTSAPSDNFSLNAGSNNLSILTGGSGDLSISSGSLGFLSISSGNSLSLGSVLGTDIDDLLYSRGGYIGIGEAFPTNDLHIKSGIASTIKLQSEDRNDYMVFSHSVHGSSALASIFTMNNDLRISTSGSALDSDLVVDAGTGYVGISETTPRSELHVSLDNNNGGIIIENNGTGNDQWRTGIGVNDMTFHYDEDGFSSTNSFVLKALVDDVDGSWDQQSDERLKTEIETLPEQTLDKVLAISPKKYYYKSDTKRTKKSIGFLAQDILELFPEMVNDESDFLSLSYAEFGVIAIKAIQEQHEIIKALELELEEIKKNQKEILNILSTNKKE